MSILEDVNDALGGPKETSELIPSDDIQIIDGDTIRIKSTGEKVRTHGIDTPEKSNKYSGKGQQVGSSDATEGLRQFSKDGLRLQRTESNGVFGRTLAKFQSPDGQDYGSAAVANGDAFTSAYTPGEYEFEKQQANDRAYETPLDSAYRNAMAGLNQQESLAAGVKMRSEDDTFATSIARGGKNLKQMSYGFVNAVAGFTSADALEKWSEDGMDQALSEAFLNPPEIHSWDDVDSLGKFGTFVVEKLGEQVPQLAADLAAFAFTGGVGSVAMAGARRAAIGKAAKRIVGEASYDKWKKDFVYDSVFKDFVPAGKAGALASIYSQSAGETQSELVSAGVDSPATALLAGIPKTALEYMSLSLLLGKTAKTLGMNVDNFAQVVGDVGKKAGIAIGTEGSTEGMQTLIDQVAKTTHTGGDVFSDEFIKELKTAVAAGAVVGGGISIGSTVAKHGYGAFNGEQEYGANNRDERGVDESVPNASGTNDSDGTAANDAGDVQTTFSAEPERFSTDDENALKTPQQVQLKVAEQARTRQDYISEKQYNQNWFDTLLDPTAETSAPNLLNEQQWMDLQLDAGDRKSLQAAAKATRRLTDAEQKIKDRETPNTPEGIESAKKEYLKNRAEQIKLKAGIKKTLGRINNYGARKSKELRASIDVLKNEQEAWSQASPLERNPFEEEAIQNAEDQRAGVSEAELAENTNFESREAVEAAAKEITQGNEHTNFELGDRALSETGVATQVNTEPNSAWKARRPFEVQKRFSELLNTLIPTMNFSVAINQDYSKKGREVYRLTSAVKPEAEADYTSDPESYEYRIKFLAALPEMLDDGAVAAKKSKEKAILVAHPEHGEFAIHAGRLTSVAKEIYSGDYDQATNSDVERRAFYDGLAELIMLGFTYSDSEAALAYKNIAADANTKVSGKKRERPNKKGRADRETESSYEGLEDSEREAGLGGDTEQELGAFGEEVDSQASRDYHDAAEDRVAAAEEGPQQPVAKTEPKPKPRKYDNYAPEMASGDAYLYYPDSRQAPFQNVTTDNQTGEVQSSGLEKALESIVKQFGTEGMTLPRIIQVTTEQMKLLRKGKSPKAAIMTDPQTGEPTVYLDGRKHINQADFERSLKHEIIAHYGWRVAIDAKDRRRILAAIKDAKNSTLKNEWRHVGKVYKKENSDVQAEEVLALIAETLDLEKHGVGKKLKNILMAILRKLGMAPARITRKDLQELLASIAKGTVEQRTPEAQLIKELKRGFDRADTIPSEAWKKAKGVWSKKGDFFPMMKFFATADRRLRQISVELADMFNEQVQGGAVGKERGFLQAKSNGWNRWLGEWKRVNTKLEKAYGAAEVKKGMDILRAADEDTVITNAVAKEFNAFFETMHTGYLKPKMPTLGHVKNYFPRVYNILEAQNRSAELQTIFEKYGEMSPKQASATVDKLLESQDGFTDELGDLVNKAKAPSVQYRKGRNVNGKGLDKALLDAGFVFSDPNQIMDHYIIGMVKRAEYQKIFGGYREVVGLMVGERGDDLYVSLDVKGQRSFNNLAQGAGIELTADTNADIQRAIDDGHLRLRSNGTEQFAEWFSPTHKETEILDAITESQGGQARQEAQKIIDAYMGRTGLDLDPKLRKAMSYAMLIETFLTLSFSAVASLPDFAGALIRTREVDVAWKALKNAMGKMAKPEQKDMYEMMGLVNQRMSHQQLLEMYGQNHANPTTQKWMERFFKWNGQEWLTDKTRVFAFETGRAFLQIHGRTPNARSKKYLGQLHLDQKTVKAWLDAGEPIWNTDLANSDPDVAIVAKKVQEALYQFVDESVVRPNAAQRPVFGSNPAYMLVWHLKSFFYSYGKQIIWPMAREITDRYKSGERKLTLAEPLAMGAMTLLPLAALSMELRELIKGDDEDEALSNRLDGLEYTQELISRSGFYGPFEIIMSLAGGYGEPTERTAHAMGPAIDHMVTLASAVGGDTPFKEALFRSIPGVSQNVFGSRDLASELYSDIAN